MSNGQTYFLSFEEIMDIFKKYKFVIAGASVSVFAIAGLRRYFSGGVCTSRTNLIGKTVVITGGNTGIGKETAIDIATRGAKVILACRDLTKSERAAAEIRHLSNNDNVSVEIVNLASLESVKAFCDNIKKNENRIDVLVNNAGIMACPKWRSDDGYELQFAVNHLGHFYLTLQLLDLIKSSAPSRIVNVSSTAHKRGAINIADVNFQRSEYNPWKSYSQSKLANILFSRELHRRLEGTGVSAFSVHPGVVSTELGRHILVDMAFYKKVLLKYLVAPLIVKTPKQGAQTQIYCSVAEGIENYSGKYFSDCAVKPPAQQAEDDVMAKKLWELSEQMVKDKIK